jgi:hypothetical protein
MNSLYFLLELYANDFYLIFLRLYFYFFQSLIIILNSILRKTLNQNLILRLDSRLCLISLIQLTIRIKLSSIPLKMSTLEKNIRRSKNRIFLKKEYLYMNVIFVSFISLQKVQLKNLLDQNFSIDLIYSIMFFNFQRTFWSML